jgi:AraC-like DNA-binding protein
MTMIETPSELIVPPRANAVVAATLLGDVLARIRLTGALFLRSEGSAPWAMDSPGSCILAEMLSPGSERIIVFHVVRKGRLWVSAGGHHLAFEEGDLAILPASHRHVMGSPDLSAAPIQIKDLLPRRPWDTIPVLRHGGGGDPTELVCGYFRCDELLFNSFLRSLPPVIKVRPVGTAAVLLDAALGRALEEGPGCSTSVRVPELLLAEALRLYSAEAAPQTGWLAATHDPVVGRALKLIHDEPLREWTVDDLARASATSRSVLGERFGALLGQSPIRYLVEWRMQLAANLLVSSDLRLAAVAEQAGYGSEAAFSRAFRRHVGMSPAHWRANRGQPVTEVA